MEADDSYRYSNGDEAAEASDEDKDTKETANYDMQAIGHEADIEDRKNDNNALQHADNAVTGNTTNRLKQPDQTKDPRDATGDHGTDTAAGVKKVGEGEALDAKKDGGRKALDVKKGLDVKEDGEGKDINADKKLDVKKGGEKKDDDREKQMRKEEIQGINSEVNDPLSLHEDSDAHEQLSSNGG